MRLTARELVIAWIATVLMLFSLSYWLCKGRVEELRVLSRSLADARSQTRAARDLLASEGALKTQLEQVWKQIPALPPGEPAENQLGRRIVALADKSGVSLPQRTPEKEEPDGDLQVLRIRWQWTGDTDSLVKFLVELQDNEVMFDTVKLRVRSQGNDRLAGDLSINCVYARTEARK